MKKYLIKELTALVVLLLYSFNLSAQGDDTEVFINQTASQFNSTFSEMKLSGYTPVSLSITTIVGEPRLSSIWILEDIGEWALYYGMNREHFIKRIQDLGNDGLTLLDMSVHMQNGKPIYSGVWIEPENKVSEILLDSPAEDFDAELKDMISQGYNPIDIQSYTNRGNLYYCCIFVMEEINDLKYAYGYIEKEFGVWHNNFERQGFVPRNFSYLNNNGTLLINGIWTKEDGSWQFINNMSESEFYITLKKMTKQGFTIVDIDQYNLRGEPRFAAIFAKDY